MKVWILLPYFVKLCHEYLANSLFINMFVGELLYILTCKTLNKGDLLTMRDRLIHTSRCRGMSRPLLKNILRYDKHLKDHFNLNTTQFCDMFNIPLKRGASIVEDLHNDQLVNQIQQEKTNIHIMTILDKDYPYLLKHINDYPLVLYLYGDSKLLQKKKSFSIIGSRRPSQDAWYKTEKIVAPLAREGFVIVSGMAKGIDTYSHLVTLRHHGKTIAVLGSGFNHIYPRENEQLFWEIGKRGLVISEYPPNQKPRRHHFPERNRLISGLVFGTVVIEARRKSGTLITVRKALNQGREVYAVPGSILNSETLGCHDLIKDGAKLVTSSEELIEDWYEIGTQQYGTIE